MARTDISSSRSIPPPPPVRRELPLLPPRFFHEGAVHVAAGLLGAVFVQRAGGVVRRARIIETEAYLGPKDLASHSSKGRTKRTEVMFGPPGRAYVYLIYGMHWMMNVVVGGEAEAVLLRAAEPLDGWDVDLSGPGRLARGFGITLADNGRSVTQGELAFHADPAYQPRIIKRKRVGVDYAGHWKNRLLRFIDVASPAAAKLRY
jgi:DNA-3-methyladenine glycosylase